MSWQARSARVARSTGREYETLSLTRAEVAALALVVALAMAWGGLLAWRHFVGARAAGVEVGLAAGSSGGTDGGATGGEAAEPGSPDGGGDPEGPPPIAVHVAGAVKTPGVYELPPGSRVIDALNAAGGATAEAAADWLNLAAKVADGEKVYVPNKKEVAAARGTGAAAGSSGTSANLSGGVGGGAGLSPPGVGLGGGKINLNLADQAALEGLPGIGPALAQRILTYRASHGPFQSIEQLRNVSGIGEAKFADLKDLVTAP